MTKITRKVIPIACAMSAPFFINADAPSDTATTTVPMNRTITPPAGPLVSNNVDVYLTADFIWWKAQQEGLSYAFNGDSFSGSGDATKGSLHEPDFRYEPGFKVGLGVLSNHDNWDFFSQYTWLKVEPSATQDKSHGDTGSNLLFATDATFTMLTAEGKWGLDFNVLDVEMGRNFWLSQRLTMRPHAGLKFSWIQQDFDIKRKNLVTAGSPSTVAPGTKVDTDADLHQFGVGIRAGLDNAFYIANHWSIFGDFALSGLWNSFKSSYKDTAIITTGASEHEPANIHYRPHTVTAVLEMDLGLRFETIFSKGRYMYMLQAGWETQVWFNQGQFVNRASFPTPGNLSMQGLTIKTGFWF